MNEAKTLTVTLSCLTSEQLNSVKKMLEIFKFLLLGVCFFFCFFLNHEWAVQVNLVRRILRDDPDV